MCSPIHLLLWDYPCSYYCMSSGSICITNWENPSTFRGTLSSLCNHEHNMQVFLVDLVILSLMSAYIGQEDQEGIKVTSGVEPRSND